MELEDGPEFDLSLARKFLGKIKNTAFRDFVRVAIEKADAGDISDLRYCYYLKEFPVSVEEFLYGRFYMDAKAHLYPKVVEELIEINSGKYVELLATGGIGAAKTTVALYTTAYQLYLLSCLRDPHGLYQLDPSSEILFTFQNISEKLAKAVDYERFKNMIEASHYFNSRFPFDKNIQSKLVFRNRIEVLPVGSSGVGAIGQNVMGGLIDELNYMAVVQDSSKSLDGDVYDQAVATYNGIARRRKSRFSKLGRLPGILCLVSSRRYPGEFTDRKEQEAQSDPLIYVYDKCVWDIKPDGSFGPHTLRIFTGDEENNPRILGPDDKLPPGKEDMVKTVPEDFRKDFEDDLINAMREIAGIATYAIHPYFSNMDKVNPAFVSGINVLSNSDTDFEETPLKIILKNIRNKAAKFPRWVHIDLALNRDAAGVTMGYVDKFVEVDRDGYIETMPHICVDFCLRVRAPTGGEIEFGRIRKLIYKLMELGVPVRWASYDTFQSYDSAQILRRRGLITGHISMDKTDIPYAMLKDAFYDSRIVIPDSVHLRTELSRLEFHPRKAKIDHPPNGSKDMADSLAGLVYGLTTQRRIYSLHKVRSSRIPKSVLRALERMDDKMKTTKDVVRLSEED